jgi:hypothetical protein
MVGTMANRMSIMSVYLPEELHEHIRQLAAQDGRSASGLVTRILKREFAKPRRAPPRQPVAPTP